MPNESIQRYANGEVYLVGEEKPYRISEGKVYDTEIVDETYGAVKIKNLVLK